MGDAGVEPGRTAARDWSQLPPDIFVSVLELLGIRDILSCAAVSHAWRARCSASRRLIGLWPEPGPYFVCSSADRDRGTTTLHNSSSGRSFHVALPDPPFRSRYVVGSSHGWLVTADRRSSLHLLNPVTGAQVALPPPESMVGVEASLNGSDVLDGHKIYDMDLKRRHAIYLDQPRFFRPNRTRLHLYEKAVLSSHPSSGDCTVLLKHRPYEHLSFARVGDTKWTWLNTIERCDNYHDFFYDDADGLFYAIRANGEIHTIDLSDPAHPKVMVVFKIRSPIISHTRYLVRAPWGDLIRIRRLYDIPPLDAAGEVTVDKVDLVSKKVTKMKDLQAHALFIGFNNTFMLPAKEFPNLTPNCVYMTDDNTELIYHSPGSGRKLVRANLEDGTFSDFSLSDSQLDWPPPVWYILPY